MKFQSMLYAATLGVASASDLHRCGTNEPDAKVKKQLDSASAKGVGKIGRASDIVVDTYVNIVTTTAKEGRYTPEQVHKQVTHSMIDNIPHGRLTCSRLVP